MVPAWALLKSSQSSPNRSDDFHVVPNLTSFTTRLLA
jgi:hypothetical protein